jgi:hypothetical protein
MVVKYWQAALLAAMMALAGNTARAQDVGPEDGVATGYAPPDCCEQENRPAQSGCQNQSCVKVSRDTVLISGTKKCCDTKNGCKDGACCKKKGDGKGCSCCKDKEDCKNCPCSKETDCCKNCECCKGKDCACGKSKECCKGSCNCCNVHEAHSGNLIFGVGVNSNGGLIGSIILNERNCDLCPAKCKQAKIVANGQPTLAFVMPAPVHHEDGSIGFHPTLVKVVPEPVMPLYVGGPIAPPCVIHHGPLPGSNCVVMPHPLPPPPPMLTPPGLPVPTMTSPVMPPQTVGVPLPPPPPAACCPCPMAASPVCAAPSYPSAPATNAGLNLDNCLSVLSVVSDLCYAHLHPTSLPGMCVSSLGMLMDLCPQSTGPAQQPEPGGCYEPAATLLPPPRPDCPASTCVANGPPQVVPCIPATPIAPAGAMEVRVVSKLNCDQLEMSVGDDSCMSCKKMTMTVGDSEITLTRLDDRVRVRGEDLKATAACVRTDRKNRLILEGDVHLRYHKDDQHASISAECIELDLTTGSVTIKPAGSSSYVPVRMIVP